MSDASTSHTQNAKAVWQKMMDEQLGRVTSMQEEMAKLEAKNAEQAQAAIEEMARLGKESLAYAGQLSAEWRKMTLEATRRVAAMMSFGG